MMLLSISAPNDTLMKKSNMYVVVARDGVRVP
jgi:hypothetical protein